jgi:hypothetical protein
LSHRGRMVVEFTTACAIVAYHYLSCECEPHSWRGVLDKALCDTVLSVTCDRSVDFSRYSNFRHKSSNWNIFENGAKHLTSNGHMMDQKFVHVVHNIKHLWVIMWHIFTNSTNNTTTILFPTQLWELLYTYHVIKQCTEKETTSFLFC